MERNSDRNTNRKTEPSTERKTGETAERKIVLGNTDDFEAHSLSVGTDKLLDADRRVSERKHEV